MKNKIVFENWFNDCEDGSCYEYGTRLIINDKKVLEEVNAIKAVKAVLEEFGIEFEMEERDEKVEEE